MHLVREARYMSDYRLLVTFDDGEERLVNLEHHLDGEVFTLLKDPEYFKCFRISTDIDTIVWENGADFSPDFLYDIGQPVNDATLAADS